MLKRYQIFFDYDSGGGEGGAPATATPPQEPAQQQQKLSAENLSLKDLGLTDPALDKFKSVSDLAKSYKETQSYISKVKEETKKEIMAEYDNVNLDYDNADEKQVLQYFQSISGINTIEDYGLPDTEENKLSDFDKKVLNVCKENGINKIQLKNLCAVLDVGIKESKDRSKLGEKITKKYGDKKEFVLGKTSEYYKPFVKNDPNDKETPDFEDLDNNTQELFLKFVANTYTGLATNSSVITSADGGNLTLQEAGQEVKRLTADLYKEKDASKKQTIQAQIDHLVRSANRK